MRRWKQHRTASRRSLNSKRVSISRRATRSSRPRGPLGSAGTSTYSSSLSAVSQHDRAKKSSRLYDVWVTIGMVLLTLVGLEIFLRVANFKEFREELTERSLGY